MDTERIHNTNPEEEIAKSKFLALIENRNHMAVRNRNWGFMDSIKYRETAAMRKQQPQRIMGPVTLVGAGSPVLGLQWQSQTMNYVGQLAETVLITVKELYKGLNPATLTGCIDIIVVRQPDGSFRCSPFHVRFGKLGVLRSREKVVDIEINGEPVDLHMKLGDNGEAFFVQESEENEVSKLERVEPVKSTMTITMTATTPVSQATHFQAITAGLVSKLERVEPVKSTMTITMTATTPVSQATHFQAITAGLEGDLRTADSWDTSCSSTTPVIRPTPVFQNGNGPPVLKDQLSAESAAAVGSMPDTALPRVGEQGAQKQSVGEAVEGEENVVKNQQVLELDPSCAQAAPAPRRADLESTEPSDSPGTKPESPRRQGSTKRSPHLGPSDIYLEDLTNLDEEQVALYFPKSDMEPGSKPSTDPSSPGHTQLLAGPTADGGTDNLSDPAHDLMHPIALSLCGGLGDSRQILHHKFVEHIISYQEFAENPEILDDPNLVIQIHKKYYNWAVAAPMILSLQAFQKNVPKSTIDRLVKEKMPKKSGRWWFSWRRRDLTAEELTKLKGNVHGGAEKGLCNSRRKMDPSSSDESISPESRPDATVQKFLPTYKKSLRLSSDQIKRLNLQDGPNEVVFSVTTQYQGTCRCEATIYLWNWDDKVVISDIDGTITKSDALGHILPQLGKDWTHQGIAKLYHKIHLNGYKFLYCSSRAIGMAHITKGYLKWVKDQGCALPKGPILLAPSSLFSAFHREVIEKKPEIFKIACLTDIRNLFGSMGQPFHAAFGNRVHDVDAYKQVGLSASHIFTVNPKGELIRELTKSQKSTYERLTELVELIFPPLGQGANVALLWPEYSQFSYWRAPLPLIDIEDLA
ncbi:Phosphatidate phosphatase LPIN3 [Chelonia mydas]|uniref:phosphatidate phosphatase n=1 Tax=Chelonia mydas TaxID=8469 RepID=M7BLY3_CHEMY|nr:Phosphatidate phosphatase LPIN3 [Chelonia mydas]